MDIVINGNIKSEVVNGRKHGVSIHYYDIETDHIQSITNYVDGRRTGEYKNYNKRGQLITHAHYDHGSLYGRYRTYHYFGEIFMDCYVEHGCYNGEYREHNLDGDITERRFYDKDNDITEKVNLALGLESNRPLTLEETLVVKIKFGIKCL